MAYNLFTIEDRVKREGDLFAPVLKKGRFNLRKAHEALKTLFI